MLLGASYGKIVILAFGDISRLTFGNSLSDNARAREALRQCLPEPLRDATFSPVLRDDAATKRCLAQLLINLSDNVLEPNHSAAGL